MIRFAAALVALDCGIATAQGLDIVYLNGVLVQQI